MSGQRTRAAINYGLLVTVFLQKGIQHSSVTAAAIFDAFEPLIRTLVGIQLYKEHFTIVTLLGFVLVLAGTLIEPLPMLSQQQQMITSDPVSDKLIL